MDSRIDLVGALGLELGEAHMIRNAGGRLADAVRSLVVSQLFLGTDAVAIIHHTDCGQLLYTDDSIRAKLRDERAAVADNIAFLPFTDLEQSVRDDLATYRTTPVLRQDAEVRGFVYDVDTGRLHEVV